MRLAPLTDVIPKPLVPLGGMHIMELKKNQNFLYKDLIKGENCYIFYEKLTKRENSNTRFSSPSPAGNLPHLPSLLPVFFALTTSGAFLPSC